MYYILKTFSGKKGSVFMIKITDVAKLANVSLATVSRVINGKNVREENRIVVEDAIKKLNYTPNFMASNLSKNKSNLILFLVPDISNPYYSLILKGIEETALKKEYNIILGSSYGKEEVQYKYLDLLNKKLIDGIILMEKISKKRINEVIKNKTLQNRIVQCSEYFERSDSIIVTIDHKKASFDATEHLIKTGKKKFYLFNIKGDFTYSKERRVGFFEALKKHGIEFDKSNEIILDHLDMMEAERAMDKLLKKSNSETGILAVSDVLAFGILKSLHRNEVLIPKDIAIVGFDGTEFSKVSTPSLSSVLQPCCELGVESFKCLMELIEGNFRNMGKKIILNHQLLIRESSKL